MFAGRFRSARQCGRIANSVFPQHLFIDNSQDSSRQSAQMSVEAPSGGVQCTCGKGVTRGQRSTSCISIIAHFSV